MDFAVGQVIGSHRVVRRLGSGGMSTVYEVEHVSLGVRSALKAYTLDHGEWKLMREKFLAEGKILARFRHPRIVRVYDFGVEGETPYFVMDLVVGPDGEPMSLEAVRSRRTVTEAEAARWYADICEGLAAVHAAGIVHRDVKLENVLVDGDGRAVLADFGISRVMRGNAVQLTAVQTIAAKTPDGKVVMGSANYLAPEVRQGADATFAADYYSLGVLLFRLLTGVWYEPKTEVMELLAPFDPAWERVVAALVADRPDDRRALPFQPKAEAVEAVRSHRLPWLWFALGLAAALGVAVAVWRTGADAGETVPVSPDELFAVPSFAK